MGTFMWVAVIRARNFSVHAPIEEKYYAALNYVMKNKLSQALGI